MIVLFTDFGLEGPYVGQLKAVLHQQAPGVPVIDLFADAPGFDARSSAYLLAAHAAEFRPGTVFLCVVDPGVGTERGALALEADGRWFVAPDNGLTVMAARRAATAQWYPIVWRPERLSASFHGRDLFAPVAARLARDDRRSLGRPTVPEELCRDWPDDLDRVVYIDSYGNAMTGLRASSVSRDRIFLVAGQPIRHAETFGRVPEGTAFWYANSNGLIELAVNRGRADELLGLTVGSVIEQQSSTQSRTERI